MDVIYVMLCHVCVASAVVCCLNVRFGKHIDQLPQLGKTELCFLLSFTCNFVVSVKKILFLLVHGKGWVIFFYTPWTLNITFFLTFPFLKPCTVDQIYCKIISFCLVYN